MAQDKSTYFRDLLLNTLRAGAITTKTPYVSLHTADPGLTGADEVAGSTYARQLGTFGAPATNGATREITNTAAVEYTSLDATTERTVTHAGVWDAATAGNFLYRINLAATKIVNAGDPASFAIGDLAIAES